MTEHMNQSVPISSSPTAKAKSAIQRSVVALLDELAPERVLTRAEQLPGRVEQHRTPTGCILQTTSFAVSVSWFAEPTKDAALGELHVILWRGTVTRRGQAKNEKGATIVSELVLRPIDPPAEDTLWRTTDGSRFDTVSLVAKCLSLLEGPSVVERDVIPER